MTYSVDANILLHASNTASPHHERAAAFLAQRAMDPDLFCIAWITLFAYLRIATHPAIFPRPLHPSEALANVTALLDLPRVRVVTEGAESRAFLQTYLDATQGSTVRGNLVPDAHLAAILRRHGVGRLYTADADFRRFTFLDVRNPLTA